ncbi:hypothetical protein SNE40_022453 [Patella caerulea]|uniref:Uncharacterized protein n=1 Tax=Patella caerulea TaxID=87958 RepID=A0AAN8IXN4_PATCE
MKTLKPLTYKIGSGLILFAIVLAIIGIPTPAWNKSQRGLFMKCDGPAAFEGCKPIPKEDHSDWEYAVIVLAVMGFILMVVSFIMPYCCHQRTPSILCSVFAGVCLIISFAVYFQKASYCNVSWACYLTLISGIISFIGGVFLIPGKDYIYVNYAV